MPSERRATRRAEPKRWRAVLEDDLREVALEIVFSIAAELRRARIRDASLASGQAGVTLLFAYLAKLEPGKGHKETARRWLEGAIDTVASQGFPASLYSGFTGVGWTAIHVQRLFDPRAGYPNAAIDRALSIYLKTSSSRGEFDLISGLAGLGVYALECLPRSSAITLLEQIVERLDRDAERNHLCWTWRTPPDFLNPERRRSYPNGCYDLGLAHGVPGIIALLAQIYATTDRKLKKTRVKARKLLNGTVNWILAQKLEARAASIFPFCIGADSPTPPQTSRLAWCYGDLAVATALLLASRSVNRSDWQVKAMVMARHAAKRSVQQSGVRDTGLCHGAAGIAHLFNRFFQISGDRELHDAARFWFRETIKRRRPRHRVAGFPARLYKKSAGFYWHPDPGFLNGAAGVALALLSAATQIEPTWDRLLLVSTRFR